MGWGGKFKAVMAVIALAAIIESYFEYKDSLQTLVLTVMVGVIYVISSIYIDHIEKS